MKHILIILSCTLTLVCCKKGEDGNNGTDGNTIMYGSGMPKMSMGKEGDYYIDSLTSVLWGPKTTSSWGSGFGMKGNTVLNGFTDPGLSTGKNGDYYLNLTSKVLFGPKTQSGWGSGLSLAKNLTVANFIYTGWEVSPGVTKDTVIDGTLGKVRHMYPKSLTSNILSQGICISYMSYGSTVFQLPYTSYAGGKANTMNAYYGLKRVDIVRLTHDVSVAADVIGMSSSLQYRHIFIPGNLMASVPHADGNSKGSATLVQFPGMDQPVDLSAMSYEEVCKFLHIDP